MDMYERDVAHAAQQRHRLGVLAVVQKLKEEQREGGSEGAIAACAPWPEMRSLATSPTGLPSSPGRPPTALT